MKQSAIEAVSASTSADQVYRLQPQPPGEVVSLMLRQFPMIVVKTNPDEANTDDHGGCDGCARCALGRRIVADAAAVTLRFEN